jgi:hypothetical protein
MKSMNAVALLFLITLILIAAPSLRATERMKSGQWEVSITENGQAHTNTHCDTEDQVKGTSWVSVSLTFTHRAATYCGFRLRSAPAIVVW